MDSYGSDFATLDFDFSCEDLVPCMLCEEQFQVINDEQALLHHLITVHKFVIGEVEEIADLRQYVLYWNKLRTLDLRDYCIVFNTNGEPGSKLPSETFYLLCKKLPEDKRLRATLSQLKLRYIINQKEKERRDETFSRKCIYCSETVTGGIANSFHHLTFKHGFSLGNPDNIVNGARLLNILEEKLSKLLCLCCEKTFKTPVLLREHMRKKQHRSLNPKNKMYDKFYLLNYLEPGTPWQEAKQRHDTENESECVDIQPQETEQDCLWTDWREDMSTSMTCLFCSFTTSKVPDGLYHHMKNYHQFDFEYSTKNLTFYQKVMVINFIRTRVRDLQCHMCPAAFSTQHSLQEHMTEALHCVLPSSSLWEHQQFLIPVMNNDGLLCHLEDAEVEDEDKIIPEDLCEYKNSVLEDDKLREEIKGTEEKELDIPVMCLFCHYTVSGEESHTQICGHMQEFHSFDFTDVMGSLPFYSQVKLINFMRWKTAKNECYICGQSFKSTYNLEEHRVISDHLVVPPSSLFQDERWLQPVLEGDGLLQRLREDGDSDEELDSFDLCQEETVFGEDIQIPPSILSNSAIRQELLENMKDLVIEEQDS